MASMPKNMVKVSLQERFVSLLDSLSAVRRLAQVNLEQVSEQGLLQLALKSLIEHYDLAFCSIFLLEGRTLRCVVGAGLEEQIGSGHLESEQWLERSMQFTLGEGIMGIACETGQIQYCRNCASDERFKPFDGKNIFHGNGSVVSVPITASGKTLGVLNVSHHQPDFFEAWQQHMLILYCNILGHTLHNHRLVHALEEALQHHNIDLERAMEESRALRARYQPLATLDDLTELPNRCSFFEQGGLLLEQNREMKLPFVLLLVDIDDFRGINDRWGHAIGDRVLVKISKELRGMAPDGELVARLGGNEFVLILRNVGREDSDEFVVRLRRRLEALDVGGTAGKLDLTVSTGMAWFGEYGEEPVERMLERLYSEAAENLASCKRGGNGREPAYDLDSPLSG
jgi:diguanylate cyclase (GGDEF)-like protein